MNIETSFKELQHIEMVFEIIEEFMWPEDQVEAAHLVLVYLLRQGYTLLDLKMILGQQSGPLRDAIESYGNYLDDKEMI